MKIDLSFRLGRWERMSLAVIGLLTVLGFIILMEGRNEAMNKPIVVRYAIDTAPKGFRPIKIAFISDMHVGGWCMSLDDEALRGIAEQVRELSPDLIVLGGDYAGTEGGFEKALAPLSGLAAPLGVVAVLGNHEYENDRNAKDMAVTLRRNGFAPLVNDHVDVGPIVVAGLDDLWKGESDIAEAGRAMADANGRPVVLVSHNPDVFPQVPRGIALTLAGHTHGSHAVFPLIGTIVSSSRFGQRFRHGLIHEKDREMVVSSGLGGVAFRWNVPPEIALITLGPRRD